MSNFLRLFFYGIVVKFITRILLGLNINDFQNLPKNGPAIIISNHNSHLDAIIIMSLIPINLLLKTHPIAAKEYFMKNRLLSWISINILGIIPISRKICKKENPLKKIYEALLKDEIIIYFPEGSRGNPEELSRLKSGIARIAKRFPSIPLTPIIINGSGKSLPKGKTLFVPFECNVIIGKPIYWNNNNREDFMSKIQLTMSSLIQKGKFIKWI